jgi:hypothetical protein
VFQVFAGKLFAFITELHLVVQKQLASFLEKSALFVSRSATFAICHSYSFVSNLMFQGKVAATNITIHSTWSYQFLSHLTEPSTPATSNNSIERLRMVFLSTASPSQPTKQR